MRKVRIYLVFYFNKTHFKIYSSTENSKTMNIKMQYFKIPLKQNQISKQINPLMSGGDKKVTHT